MKLHSLKNKIEKFLNNKTFELFIIGLISLNLIVFILQTDSDISRNFTSYFKAIETASVVIFTLEYILRIAALQKIKDFFNIYLMIDLLAILPFYLSFVNTNTLVLRTLRFFKFFRVIKVARYIHAWENIKTAFIRRKDELLVMAAIFAIAILISSVSIYYAEHNVNENFKSIPSSFWWAIITFSTVGYGDVYPITTIGKFIASCTAIFGVGLHGLLIGLISSSIIDVIKENKGVKND